MKKSNLTKEQLDSIRKPFTEVQVLCKYCKKPIHIAEWGGVQNNEFFHKVCYDENIDLGAVVFNENYAKNPF